MQCSAEHAARQMYAYVKPQKKCCTKHKKKKRSPSPSLKKIWRPGTQIRSPASLNMTALSALACSGNVSHSKMDWAFKYSTVSCPREDRKNCGRCILARCERLCLPIVFVNIEVDFEKQKRRSNRAGHALGTATFVLQRRRIPASLPCLIGSLRRVIQAA